MKAAVLHHSLNRPGGETTVALQIIESLHDIGYDVELISVEKLIYDDVATAYGKKVVAKNTRYLFPRTVGFFGLYQRLLTGISSLGLKDIDLIISTNGTVLPLGIQKHIPSILYVHFPTALLNSVSYYASNDRYRKSLFWKTYSIPYRILANKLTKSALSRSSLVVANSYFTKNAIRKVYPRINPEVLYPPVEIDRFSLAYNSSRRESRVIVISRFSPEKQIEKAIEIAKIVKNVEFEVVGFLAHANRQYFKSLEKMIERNGLENKMRLTPNVSYREMIDKMSVSKVYLHTTFGEHFGVSVIEAMAAGLITVVPSIGGCSEIVPSEYQYSRIEDAASLISSIICEYDEDKRKQVYNIAKKFSFYSFRENLRNLVEVSRINQRAKTTKKGPF
jgi:glycosyltransferase involved in cell wall biosynthesis